jgi:hypothetical protein
MRFLLRLFSLISLAAATIAGTLDSIQSIAASRLEIASLAASWRAISQSSFDHWNESSADKGNLHFNDYIVAWLLAQPAFAIFLAIALLLWIVAYRRVSTVNRLTV